MREGALSPVARNEQLAEIQDNYSAWSSVAEEHKEPSADHNFTMHITKNNKTKHQKIQPQNITLSHFNNGSLSPFTYNGTAQSLDKQTCSIIAALSTIQNFY